MTRSLIVGVLLVFGACTTNLPPPKAATAGKQREILMYRNDGHLTSAPATCLGSVTPYLGQQIRTSESITWKIDNLNDPNEECQNLDYTKVEVVFTTKVLLDPDTNMQTDRLKGKMGGVIKGSIWKDAPYGHAKYSVHYGGAVASEDPELDINGDCTPPGCVPQ